MATRTNPLVSAAVLASAAAIAVATPAIATSVQLPTPHALQAAKVQLATFADVLSITPEAISNTLFNGWGEAISPNQDLNIDWAAEFVGANVPRCDFSCTVNGPSGIVYMYLDALINGNGAGIDNIGGITKIPCGLCNSNKPFQPDPTKPNYNYPAQPDPSQPNYNPYTTPPWGVSALNYFFEGGTGPGTQYLLSAPFGNPASPLYNPAVAPAVASVIAQAFQGAFNVTIFYVQALNTISLLAANVPAVGPYIWGGIQAYLGYPGYPEGPSGILKYILDVAANGGQNPIPVPVQGGTGSAAATLAAATAATEVSTLEVAPVSKVAKDSAPAVAEVNDSPTADSKVEVKDSAPAVAEVKDSAPADSKPVVSEVEDATPVADDTKTVEAPKVEDVKDSTPAADSTPDAPEVSVPDTKDIEKELAKAEKEDAKAEASSSSAGSASGSKAVGSDATSEASEATSNATPAASEAKSGASGAGGSEAESAKDAGDSAK